MSVALAPGHHGRPLTFGSPMRESATNSQRMAAAVGRSVLGGGDPRPTSEQARLPVNHYSCGVSGPGMPFGREDFALDGSTRNHFVAPYLQAPFGTTRTLQDEPSRNAGSLGPAGRSTGRYRRGVAGFEGNATHTATSSGSMLGSTTSQVTPASLLSSSRSDPLNQSRRDVDPQLASRTGGAFNERLAVGRRANDDLSWSLAPLTQHAQRQASLAAPQAPVTSLLEKTPSPRQQVTSKPLPTANKRVGPDDGRVALLSCFADEPNSCYRAHMEDSAVVVDPFHVDVGDTERWGFFAVYDGHGGRQAADYAEAKLHEIVLNELRSLRPNDSSANGGMGRWSDEVIADALTRSFQRVDDQLRLVGAWRCGCTATIALVRRTQNEVRLHIANVGDSRAVVVDAVHGECRVSRDHRPTDPSEVRRVEAEGGFVSRARVAGQLGVSRALGDHALKASGVSWRPYIGVRDATKDVALVIASDGVWDAMSDSDARAVIDSCIAGQMPDQAARQMVEEAQKRGSTDNITCLVAFFNGVPQA